MLPTMKLFSPEFDGQPASTTRALAGSVRAKLYHVLTQCQSRLASIRGEALNTSPQHRADAVLTLSGAHQVAPPTLTTLPLEIQQQIYQEWFSSISWSIIDANICTAWGRFTYIPPKSRTGKKLLKQRLQQYQPGQPVYIIAETGRSGIPMCNSVELRMVSRAFYNACNPIFFRKVAFDISCRLWDLWAHDHKDLKLPLVLSSRLQYLDLDFEHIELLLPTLVTTTATFTAGYRPELIMALVPNLKHLETRCRGSCSRVSFGYKVTLYGPGDPQVLAFCHARKMFRTTITFLVESNIGFGLCNTVSYVMDSKHGEGLAAPVMFDVDSAEGQSPCDVVPLLEKELMVRRRDELTEEEQAQQEREVVKAFVDVSSTFGCDRSVWGHPWDSKPWDIVTARG